VYEQSTGRRIGPALIAVLVVLAGTAGTFAYLVTKRIVAGQATASPPTATGTPTTPRTTAPRTTTATARPPTNTTRPATQSQSPPDPGDACHPATVQALANAGVNSTLEMLLYVQVRRPGELDAEIWICKNADGLLIYQGHVLSGDLDVADNGNNTILLAEGIKGTVDTEGGDGWKATNPSGSSSTEYHVSRERLVIVRRPSNRETDYTVIRAKP
jgi:hypothetical protein